MLHAAANKGMNKEVMSALITTSEIPIDKENSMGLTPLHVAGTSRFFSPLSHLLIRHTASRGFDEVAEELIKAHADVNKANPKKNHQTPLHYAAAKG